MITCFIISVVITANIKERNSGLKVGSPSKGQTYFVTAADVKMKMVIAMPYKLYVTDDTKTDRRFLLKVSNPYVCSNGVWFTETKEGQELIISSPIEANTPERTAYY